MVAPMALAPIASEIPPIATPTAGATSGMKTLTPQQKAVVQYIVAHGNVPVTPRELVTGLGLKQQTVATLVQFMVEG
jgi:hypothetical protein